MFSRARLLLLHALLASWLGGCGWCAGHGCCIIVINNVHRNVVCEMGCKRKVERYLIYNEHRTDKKRMMKHFAILCGLFYVYGVWMCCVCVCVCTVGAHGSAGRQPNIASGNRKWFFGWNGKLAGNFCTPYNFNNRKTKL